MICWLSYKAWLCWWVVSCCRIPTQADELLNAFSVKPDHSVVFNASVPKKINICNIENSVFYIDRMLWLCMCADAWTWVGCFSLWILRMNMCERIYFTVDVSGTSNLFSRFVHLWLAWETKCGGHNGVHPMVGPWWTLVPGAASWSWRLWLALLFGWPDTWKNSLALGFCACSHCSFGLCYVPVFRPAPFRDIPLCRVRVVNQKLCPGCRLSVLRCDNFGTAESGRLWPMIRHDMNIYLLCVLVLYEGVENSTAVFFA